MDIKVGYSNQKDNSNDEIFEINQRKESNYVEFVGITRVRRGTTGSFDDMGINQSEKIINDIVNMDAEFDTNQLPDLSIGSKNLFSTSQTRNNNQKPVQKYSSFHTIDWQRDFAKDRFRHKWLKREKNKGFFEKILALNDAWSGWLCVLLVGCGAGIVAGIVDIGSGFTSSLRSGFCNKAFWLNKDQCCWDSKSLSYDEYKVVRCDEWVYWSAYLSNADKNGNYYFSWFIHVVISMLFAVTAALFVKAFAPYACGSGVPEIKTILSGFVIRGYLGKWTLLIKSVGMILGTSAGLTLGKEGPFVHVSSCCGNIFSYLFPKYGKNEAKKREILSAAAAAGVAVAFGAPIGGVLFSLEEVSYYFPLKTMWRSFFCAMIAAFIVRTVNPLGKGHEVLFFIEYRAEWFLFELFPFIFLGMLGGIFGYYFIKLNIYWCRLRKTTKLGKFPITEVLVIALITSFFGYLNEYTRMPMSELINRLVSKCGPVDDFKLCDYQKNVSSVLIDAPLLKFGPGVFESVWKLILALIFYLIMIVITFGIKIPCGLFVPSLAMGAICGRLVGILMQLVYFKYPSIFSTECKFNQDCIMPGVYALVGACAFLGGATRMTVSLVVIMVELTSGLSLIVPLMVSSFTAKLFGELLCKGGIYDAHINLNGYPFLDNKEEYEYSALAIDVMKPQKNEPPLVVLVQEGMTMEEIEKIYTSCDINGFPIVVSKESQILLGYIFKRDLKMAFEKYKASGLTTPQTLVKFSRPLSNRTDDSIRLYKLVDMAPTCVGDQTPMEVVIDFFRKIGVSIVLVCHHGKLLGTISKKDIIKHLESENLKHQK